MPNMVTSDIIVHTAPSTVEYRDSLIDSDDEENGDQSNVLSNSNLNSITSAKQEQMNGGQLFREEEENECLTMHINELRRFGGLYLEQLLHDCNDLNVEHELTKRLERVPQIVQTTQVAMSQVRRMASMQVKVEKCCWCVPSISVAQQINLTPKPCTPISKKSLRALSVEQLKLIVNDLQTSMKHFNVLLLNELAERDEHHLQQIAKCTEIEDLSAYFKDYCVRASIQRYRRESIPEAQPIPLSAPPRPTNLQRTSLTTQQPSLSKRPRSDTEPSKNRFFHALFGRKKASI